MSSLDTAIEAANAKSAPRLLNTAGVPAKGGAPSVKVEKSGHRIRLRNIDHALEGCVSTRQGETRFRLEPNKWTEVDDAVYSLLKEKFYAPIKTTVPDWNGDVNNPQRTERTEITQEYTIEFPDEYQKESI